MGVPERTPAADNVRHEGRVPLEMDHVYGETPPETASVWENCVPTEACGIVVVVIEGAGGTVNVTVAVSEVLATEVAVTVTVVAELAAAGAVYVAEVVVVFERVPPPLTDHVTPAAFLSFVTVAVNVAVSVGSTVEAEDVTATLTGFELPPHPAKKPVTKRQESVNRATLNVRVNDPVNMAVLS
jgi:hypothetical protein